MTDRKVKRYRNIVTSRQAFSSLFNYISFTLTLAEHALAGDDSMVEEARQGEHSKAAVLDLRKLLVHTE